MVAQCRAACSGMFASAAPLNVQRLLTTSHLRSVLFGEVQTDVEVAAQSKATRGLELATE